MKNPVLKKASDHFKEQLASGLKSIEVPQWESTVWFKPVMTLKEQTKIFEYHQKGQLVEALVQTLIVRAKTEDGKPMFQQAEFVFLMNEVDPEVVTKIVTTMNKATDEDDASLGN
jgi:hypothetical protein